MAEEIGPSQRLYGMMQFLMSQHAQADQPAPAAPRGVVELDDALDAVMQLAAVIDEQTQAGHIPVERGLHAASMLMVVREALQPLPPTGPPGTPDACAAALQAMVTALRAWRAPDELPADWQ